MTNRRALALSAAAAAVVLAGCSSGGSEDGQAAAKKAAVAYQEAVLDNDWNQVCELKTPRMRGGSVAECVELAQAGPDDDGGSKAEDVSVENAVAVEADSGHPSGVGLVIRYQVEHPNGEQDTARKALRLVKAGDAWKVDQTTTLNGGDGTDAAAIRAALRGQ